MKLDDLMTAARRGGDASTDADRERVRAKLAARLRAEESGRYGRVVVEAPSLRAAIPIEPAMPLPRRGRRLSVTLLLAAAILAVGTAAALEVRRVIAERAATESGTRVHEVDGAPAQRGSGNLGPTPTNVAPDSTANGADSDASAIVIPPVATSSAPALATPSPRATGDRSSPAGAPSSRGLEDQMALVQHARSALHRGAPAEALADLDRYDAQYRRGTFGQEVAALRVLALCDLGRADEARARGASFLRAWPRSPLSVRIQSSCAGDLRNKP